MNTTPKEFNHVCETHKKIIYHSKLNRKLVWLATKHQDLHFHQSNYLTMNFFGWTLAHPSSRIILLGITSQSLNEKMDLFLEWFFAIHDGQVQALICHRWQTLNKNNELNMMQFTSHFESQGWGPWWPNPKWEPSPILGLVNSWHPMSLLAYLLSKSFSFTAIPFPTMFMSLDLPGTQNKVIANEWHVLARITFSPKQDHPWTHLLLDSIDSLMNVFSSGHPLSTRPMCPSSSLSNIFSLIIVHYQRHISFPAHSFSSLIFSSKKVLFLKHILSFTPFPPQRTVFFWGPHLLRTS